jgi:hypothetical protein
MITSSPLGEGGQAAGGREAGLGLVVRQTDNIPHIVQLTGNYSGSKASSAARHA